MEATILGSEKQQAAAMGLVAILIMGMSDLNDAVLVYSTFQDMLEYKQFVALSTSLCTHLLQHDEPQVCIPRQLYTCPRTRQGAS